MSWRAVDLVSCIVGSIGLFYSGAPRLEVQVPGQTIPPLPHVNAQAAEHGMEATIGSETLSLTVCSESIVHVVTKPDGKRVEHPQPWLLPPEESCKGAPFQVSQTAREATLSTDRLRITLSLDRGNLIFRSADGTEFLQESASAPRTYAPVTLNGEATYWSAGLKC
jgi:hypothetical protein